MNFLKLHHCSISLIHDYLCPGLQFAMDTLYLEKAAMDEFDDLFGSPLMLIHWPYAL